MDNDNLSKVPVSELTPDNINALKGNQTLPEPPKKVKSHHLAGNNRLPLIIAGAVLLVGIVVALFFIFRQPSTEPEGPGEEPAADPVEVAWQAPKDSEDPNAEYLAHFQDIMNSPDSSSEDQFSALLTIANFYTVASRYDESETLLNSVQREGLSVEQKYRLYSVYQYLYEQSGNTAAAKEYQILTDKAMAEYWGSQLPTEEPLAEE